MRIVFAVLLLTVVLSGCTAARVETPVFATSTLSSPSPTVKVLPTETPAPTGPAAVQEPARTLPPASEETPEEPPDGPPIFPLARPILPPGREVIDPTYRFGTTQGGEREVHYGVEFLNSQGTPVSAAATGTVLFAGDDFNGSPFSPRGWFAFYGLFVVLEHHIAGFESPVYTVYGHLSEILVSEGDVVRTGQPLGLVGFTGAAVGSHLHFEVRFGGTTYQDVRNPEIWLQPQEGNGSLAGAIVDAGGLPLPVVSLQLKALDGPGYTQYFSTYEDTRLSFLPPLAENFAIGNLPPGTYELSFVAYRLETHTVEILPGERTFLSVTVGNEP